ncbi:MAG: hypothetical protein ACK5PF_11310 [bacterium]|jgi:hypothetical protein
MDKWILEGAIVLGGLILATFQWLIKNWVKTLEKNITDLHNSQKEIDKEVKVIKETYVPRADLKDIKDEIVERLSRIESFLMRNKDV